MKYMSSKELHSRVSTTSRESLSVLCLSKLVGKNKKLK